MEARVMRSEAKKKSQAKFDKLNTTHYGLKLNNRTDLDIMKRFEEVGSVQTYIKRLIREDIAREEKKEEDEVGH